MLQLRRIASLDVYQRRIRLHDPTGHKVVQTQQILVLAETVEIPTAEGECAEVLGDGVEEGAGAGDAQGDGGGVDAFGVVGRFELEGVLTMSGGKEGTKEVGLTSSRT